MLSHTGVVASFCSIKRTCVRTAAASSIVLFHLVGLGIQRFINSTGKLSILLGGSASFPFRATRRSGRLCVGRHVNQWSLGGISRPRRVGEESCDWQKTLAHLEKPSVCFRCAKGLIVHLLRTNGGLEESELDVYER